MSEEVASSKAVRKLGLQSLVIEAQTPEEYERAFARLSAEKVHASFLGLPKLQPDVRIVEAIGAR